MKLLIDTNIVLDVLLKREPFYQAAVKVMNLAQYDDTPIFGLNENVLWVISKKAVERHIPPAAFSHAFY